MAAPLVYADGAVITYNTATGTIAPTTGLQLDGLSLSAAVPETVINTPTISGLHLVTVYIRIVNPASGGASPSSTLGPATVFFTCADCLIPVTLITGMLLQDGTFSATNSDNTTNTCLSGSVVVNALAGDPIAITLGYASSAATTTAECAATLTSAAWNALAIGLRTSGTAIGGASTQESAGATTLTVAYAPTAGNCAVLSFNAGASAGTVTVKDNLGNTLTAGPTSGNLRAFHQYPVPSGVTGYTATWTTARQASLVVEEYSGVTAVDITLAGNTATGSSGTAAITVTPDEVTDTVVCMFGNVSSDTMTGSIGNQRQRTLGSAVTAPITLMDSMPAAAMKYSYHVRAVFIGALPS